METKTKYVHEDDFDGLKVVEGVMPEDVKRLMSHCGHTYKHRYYFFSPSERSFYWYFKKDDGSWKSRKLDGSWANKSKRSVIYSFIPDEFEAFSKMYDYRDTIVVTDRFMKRIEKMNKLELPSLRPKVTEKRIEKETKLLFE